MSANNRLLFKVTETVFRINNTNSSRSIHLVEFLVSARNNESEREKVQNGM